MLQDEQKSQALQVEELHRRLAQAQAASAPPAQVSMPALHFCHRRLQGLPRYVHDDLRGHAPAQCSVAMLQHNVLFQGMDAQRSVLSARSMHLIPSYLRLPVLGSSLQ